MQMWYNDSMISSSKRREKGYRFDSHEHANCIFCLQPAATSIRGANDLTQTTRAARGI